MQRRQSQWNKAHNPRVSHVSVNVHRRAMRELKLTTTTKSRYPNDFSNAGNGASPAAGSANWWRSAMLKSNGYCFLTGQVGALEGDVLGGIWCLWKIRIEQSNETSNTTWAIKNTKCLHNDSISALMISPLLGGRVWRCVPWGKQKTRLQQSLTFTNNSADSNQKPLLWEGNFSLHLKNRPVIDSLNAVLGPWPI